ncbi:MotA/TolQ/ExbB proton channel family protein [Algibacillus agarilyticus]|uniref:MotA/TolQ/ExbB proton channel family protein n=1 Tax=Algibacillus agarilyticus TaxID=2234133 RepID=UPI000DCF807B|nr:MotA/TolQ/ExbB proton channel family protein [Algibacillus agarilyticus]
MIQQLEYLMYQLSDFFMAPVLILIAALFIYALFASGQYVMQIVQRKTNKPHFYQLLNSKLANSPSINLAGYPLADLANQHPKVTKDQLDVAALGELEGVRNVSRLAPMLGLIATMVPMGPALKGLADGNIQGISENLIVAFSAVIFGLVIASITFWIASVKKRWLAEELVALTPLLEESKQAKIKAQIKAQFESAEGQQNEAA